MSGVGEGAAVRQVGLGRAPATGRDEVGEVAGRLAEDGVSVDPALAAALGTGREAALEEAVVESPVPLFVVAHPLPYDGPFGGRADELLTLVHDRSGEPGVYLAVTDLGSESSRVEGLAWEVPVDAWQVGYAANELQRASGGDGLDALVEAADIVRDGRVEEAYAEASALADQRWEAEQQEDADGAGAPGTGSTDGSGTGSSEATGGAADDGPPASALLGAGLVAVLLLAAAARARRRRAAPAAGWRLPASAVSRVRSAEDQRLTRQARSEVLALGEALDARDIGPRDDRPAWQAALDHYEAASRLLDRKSAERDLRVLDTVGAVVLARRGRDALAAATAGRSFGPAPVCLLDPLHPAPRQRGRVQVAGQAVDVPLCTACRRDLQHGREPDVLDVERRGRAVHYLDTDTVWARTGYGALVPDLLTELRTRPGG